jgi:hypothetical protein
MKSRAKLGGRCSHASRVYERAIIKKFFTFSLKCHGGEIFISGAPKVASSQST